MNGPIGITPADLWQIIVAVCAAIVTISGAITVVIGFVTKARHPNKVQNERIEKLEEEVTKINERLQLGNTRFQTDSERVDALEHSISITNKVIIESLQALMEHAIDGNDTENLKQVKKKIDDYLIEKV